MVVSRYFIFGDTPPWKEGQGDRHILPLEQHDELKLETAASASVPSVRVPRDDVLLMNVELDADLQIPFSAFDALRKTHAIDVSAISVSSTHRGNLYRALVLQTASM